MQVTSKNLPMSYTQTRTGGATNKRYTWVSVKLRKLVWGTTAFCSSLKRTIFGFDSKYLLLKPKLMPRTLTPGKLHAVPQSTTSFVDPGRKLVPRECDFAGKNAEASAIGRASDVAAHCIKRGSLYGQCCRVELGKGAKGERRRLGSDPDS